MDINDDVKDEVGAYLIVDPHDEKAYVGSTSTLRTRGLRHERELKAGRHFNQELQEHYNKHNGNLLFVATPLDNRDMAYDFEQSVIDDFHNTPVLCNIAIDARDAGKGFQLSMSHKAKLIESNTGRPKSEAHREAISKKLTGRQVSPEVADMLRTVRLGATNTQEHNEKIREARIGTHHTEETCLKMSDSAKRRGIPPEQQAKMTEARKGLPMSPGTSAALAVANKKPVEINGVCYPSIQDACSDLNMTMKMVGTRLNSDKYPEFKRIDKKGNLND